MKNALVLGAGGFVGSHMVKRLKREDYKDILINHINQPRGLRGRNSNNDLIKNLLDWNYKYSLKDGLSKTYSWVENQIKSI